MHLRSVKQLIVALATNAALVANASAAGLEVKATSETTPTPPLFGHNFSSLVRPESLAWLEHAGGTSTRFRTSASCIESYPSSPESISRWTFIQRRHEIVDDLRDHPEAFDNGTAQRHVDWGAIRSAYQGGSCGDLESALDAFDAMGQKPLILIDSKNGVLNSTLEGPPSDPNQPTGEYWFQRWFVWRHYFIQAYYHARVHGTVNYEFVNEPDLDDQYFLTVEEDIERQTLAGDAIQRALETVNRWRTPQSLPALQAVVNTSFASRSLGAYQSAVVAERVLSDFYSYTPSTAWAFPTSFNSYAYHQYLNNNPLGTVVSSFNSLRADVTAATGSSTFPISVTEINLRYGNDAANHDWTDMTQDSVRNAIGVANMLHEINRTSLNGAYVFKFGDSLHATHWMGGSGNVGGTKRAGDVVRLFGKGFAGGLSRKQYTETSDAENFRFDVAFDPIKRHYSVLSINHHCDTLPAGATDSTATVCDAGEADNQTLTIDMAAWGIPAGTQVIAEEVSSRRRGEVRRFYTVDAQHRVQILAQPAQSAVLVTIPIDSSTTIEHISPTADGYARAGDFRANTFPGSNLYAYANTTDANNRRAAYLKFTLPANLDPDDIALAVLKVTARSGQTETLGSGSAVGQVYGVDDDSWTEADLRWNVAPGLLRETATLGDITTVADNPLHDIGVTVHPVGSITTNSEAPTEELIDVTDYVRSQANGVSSFVIVREIRFEGDTSAADSQIWMGAREHANASYRPVLEIVRRCGALSC